jgi:hypothetical protein
MRKVLTKVPKYIQSTDIVFPHVPFRDRRAYNRIFRGITFNGENTRGAWWFRSPNPGERQKYGLNDDQLGAEK